MTHKNDSFIVTRRSIRALLAQMMEPSDRPWTSTPEALADSWLASTPDVEALPPSDDDEPGSCDCGWSTRGACLQCSVVTPEVSAYPSGVVNGPCVCGSWPGGECLHCPTTSPVSTYPTNVSDIEETIGYLRGSSAKEYAVMHTAWLANLIERLSLLVPKP